MSALLIEETLIDETLVEDAALRKTRPMGRVAVAPRPLAPRPAAARTPGGPNAARPVVSIRHLADVRPVACQVAVDEPTWELTRRGLVVVMTLLATVMGSAVVTCLVAFLSISNSPL